MIPENEEAETPAPPTPNPAAMPSPPMPSQPSTPSGTVKTGGLRALLRRTAATGVAHLDGAATAADRK